MSATMMGEKGEGGGSKRKIEGRVQEKIADVRMCN